MKGDRAYIRYIPNKRRKEEGEGRVIIAVLVCVRTPTLHASGHK